MDGSESKKTALIRMLQIYLKYGGFNRPLIQNDFVNYLKEEYDIKIERKAVSRNIALLKEIGFDIETTRSGTFLGGENPAFSVMSVLDSSHSIDLKSEQSVSHYSEEYNKPGPDRCEMVAEKDFMPTIRSYFGRRAAFSEYPDDVNKVSVIVYDVIDAIHFSMHYSTEVELVSPPEARDIMKKHILNTAKKYLDKK